MLVSKPADQKPTGNSVSQGPLISMVNRVAATVLAVTVCSSALARDLDGHYSQSPLKAWFDALTSRKGPCCSHTDGMTVADPDWDSKDGGYRVRLYGQWWDVPPEAVITTPNLARRTIVWPVYEYLDGMPSRVIDIRCFIPGSMI